MGLWYSKDTGMSLTASADADHAGCQDTIRCTSGSAQFLGDKLVSWSSKKQKRIAISSTKAEYIALFEYKECEQIEELLWRSSKKLMRTLGKGCWWEIIRRRPTAAIKDHMISSYDVLIIQVKSSYIINM
ncbi:hypothetical protein Tco_0946817 [Tanacetum coccineum]